MRSLIAVSIVIIVIIGGWFLAYNYIDTHATDLIQSLDHMTKNIESENWDSAVNEYLQIKKQWGEIRNRWAVMIHHHEIDNIDLAMARTRKYIEEKDKPLSLGEIEVLKQLFHIVKESEAVTLTNLL
ncbi:hypothetical protein HNQ80_003048 [Anaerosolibacter carboniphilus]|uniref:DUF4363 family protein n=1 Tax=Anaerosolibacter carboniphilus TaxID=1417629 RepID=A0A841KU97_9FIRM|nr:DUF4363 family protein [Anaerosolibacter carboniphilus]MBB6216943.1 hypothetical protein [Anaerosolibacter carboniphilus]